jgi:FlaG/FlaF family flagellin (archaellin)
MPLKVVKDSVVAAVDTATEEVAAAASEVVEAEVSAAEVEEEATEGVDGKSYNLYKLTANYLAKFKYLSNNIKNSYFYIELTFSG